MSTEHLDTLANRFEKSPNWDYFFLEQANTNRPVWTWMDSYGPAYFELTAAPHSTITIARHELRAFDPAFAASTFARVFDWTAEPIPNGWRLSSGLQEMATVRAAVLPGITQWRHYIGVDHLEAAVARAEVLGALVFERDDSGVWLQHPVAGEFGLAASKSIRDACTW